MGQSLRVSTLGQTSPCVPWATVSRSAHATHSWAIANDPPAHGSGQWQQPFPNHGCCFGVKSSGNLLSTDTKNINRGDTCLYTWGSHRERLHEDTPYPPADIIDSDRSIVSLLKTHDTGLLYNQGEVPSLTTLRLQASSSDMTAY